MTKPIRIDQWSVVDLYRQENDFMRLPERAVVCLHGLIYGHPKHDDGKAATTSQIIGKHGDNVVTFSGSVYELGEPDPEFTTYPDARSLLLSRLAEVPAPTPASEVGR